jgi:uncharacterized SAM-binding protein YcdF (DUF218 family)
MRTEAEIVDRPETAIVFTGDFNRVERGLYLLQMGQVDRLFISGVNPEAGIPVDGFDEQFVLTGDLLEARRNGSLVLGTEAQNTLENAAEAACWLKQEGIGGPVLLISSTSHLQRAIAALSAAVTDVQIVGMGVWESLDTTDPSYRASERAKLEATRLLGLLPQRFIVREGLADCSAVEFR